MNFNDILFDFPFINPQKVVLNELRTRKKKMFRKEDSITDKVEKKTNSKHFLAISEKSEYNW